MAEPEPPFTPIGNPQQIETYVELTKEGEVAVTRGDVERAITTADEELKKYMKAGQKK